MRFTERDKLVLKKSLAMLVWLGLICWAVSYSMLLALAVSYLVMTHGTFRKYVGR